MAYAKHLVAFAAGMMFALGLGISRLLLPTTIRGFLDVAGKWDPTVAIVMGAGCLTYFCFDLLAKRRSRPLIAEKFTLPKQLPIDTRLIAGATLFGIGWGAAGACPGPAITGALWNHSMLAFAISCFAGVAIFELGKSWFAPSHNTAVRQAVPEPVAGASASEQV